MPQSRQLACVSLVTMLRRVALAVAMFWAITPTMACLMPEMAMTAAEHECCKKMAAMCGGEQHMPQSHSCCKSITQAAQAPFAAREHRTTVRSLAAPAMEIVAPAAIAPVRVTDPSPPGSSPGLASAVLRI